MWKRSPCMKCTSVFFINWTRYILKPYTVSVVLSKQLLQWVKWKRKSVQQAPGVGKKKSDVRVSYGEEREGWQWEGASLIWSSVICRLDPCTQNMFQLKEMERGRENRDPVIHLASLCCCLGPMVTSEIEDEHERELRQNPFTDSKKSAPDYSESKYQLKQAASPFSLFSEFMTCAANEARSGMVVKPAAIWIHLWWIEHGTYANSTAFLASAACIPAQPRLYLECEVVAVKQNTQRCSCWQWEPGFASMLLYLDGPWKWRLEQHL